VFPFSGHKDSFFGDLHVMGKDGVAFYTETKAVTSHSFSKEEIKETKVGTWDGTIFRTCRMRAKDPRSARSSRHCRPVGDSMTRIKA
jgi:hypothetical protein